MTNRGKESFSSVCSNSVQIDLVCCPPTSLLNSMEREADVTRSFLRHLRFNSRDMNTIFESGAQKLNGQTAANLEFVL